MKYFIDVNVRKSSLIKAIKFQKINILMSSKTNKLNCVEDYMYERCERRKTTIGGY